MASLELIASVTVGSSGAANIGFTNIPQTYLELIMYTSLKINASTSLFTFSMQGGGSEARMSMYGTGGIPAKYQTTVVQNPAYMFSAVSDGSWANGQFIFPNYTSTTGLVGVSSYGSLSGSKNLTVNNLRAQNSGIASITLTPNSGSLLQYSSAYLYGAKNA